MPLPQDPELLKLSNDLVDTMRATFDTPENYRPGTTPRRCRRLSLPPCIAR